MGGPFIIGVGGGGSSAGKTTIASALIRELSRGGDNAGNEPHGSAAYSRYSLSAKKRWGAIKYSKTEFYSSIIDDSAILNEPDKDTRRFIEAGAMEVLWVQSPPENLHEIMPLSLDRLYHLDGIVIEGNSAIEYVKPDVIVFVSAGGNTDIKQSAWKLLDEADIVIMSKDLQLSEHSNIPSNCKILMAHNFPKNLEKDIIKEIILHMDKSLTEKRVAELLIEHSTGSSISCSDARKIAEETGLSYSGVGRLADELKIKIRNCELGCF